jgi:hypothetical protein
VLVCASCGHENSDRARFCEECGFSFAAVPARPNEQRKTVTVLFCDLAGSTALGETLDPERLRALLAGFFERMRRSSAAPRGGVEVPSGCRDGRVRAPVVRGRRPARGPGRLRRCGAAELDSQGRIGADDGRGR